MKQMKIYSFLLLLILFTSCQTAESQSSSPTTAKTIEKSIPSATFINPEGQTIKTRFLAPAGFSRNSLPENSYADYLQNLPLHPHGAKVHYYNGAEKYNDVYEAVVNIDVGKRDLQQCADAIMRLRAEHFYAQRDYERIHFNFVSGDRIDYDKWRKGYRVKVSGNKVSWVKSAAASDDYKSFRKYMDIIFSYAGTLSLAKELKPVSMKDIQIGDVFIQGGSPGHAVVVIDMVENKDTGERRFLLAQSYMPAQEIHVLKNMANADGSPWYSNFLEGDVSTPEWGFRVEDLKRF
jgi:hypothetical protein